MARTLTLITLLMVTIRTLQAANILGLFPIKSRSHQIIFQPIWRELSLRGHNVTILTPFPLNDSTLTNLTEINVQVPNPIDCLDELFSNRMSKVEQSKVIANLYRIAIDNLLSSEGIRDFFSDKNKATYDLILVQFNYPTLCALSERFKCPFVGIGNAPLLMGGYRALGNPEHPALQPKTILDFRVHLSLFQRFSSVFHSVWNDYYHHFNVLPRADSLIRNYLEKEEDLPYLGDIESKVSMVLSVGNFMTYATKANVPGLVDLENVHVGPDRSLPVDLQEELDKAENGAVYLSLGSNSLLGGFPERRTKLFVQAMSELPYRFFWKLEGEDAPPEMPENVVARAWFPQQDVLSHPNVKLFITQGGLQSLEEAISRGVPLLGIPLFADQHSNLHKMAYLGVAKVLDEEQMARDEFKAAVTEMMEDRGRRTKMRRIEAISKDFPMTGVGKVIWWVEYVIRHKGAVHLRSPAMELHWYQYYMVDVLGFSMVLVSGGAFTSYRLVKLIFRFREQ